jgi:exonuclease-1
MLHRCQIPFIVAPYEADAQLGFLYRQGMVDLVITEDSDALVYGCRTVLYKLDGTGHGQLVCADDIVRSPALGMFGFSERQVRTAARP